MKKKIVGIFVCAILIASAPPAMGYINDHLITENEFLMEGIEIRPEFITNEVSNPHYLYDNQVHILVPSEELGHGWNYSNGVFCADFPALPVDFALVWKLDTSGIFALYLIFSHEYDFQYYYDNGTGTEYEYQSFGYVEISNTDGTSWDTLVRYNGSGNDTEEINITPWIGGNLSIRFRCVGIGDTYFSSSPGGHWCLWDLKVKGMKDDNAPVSTINLTGNKEEYGWYNTPVLVEITATDYESGVKEIHYILDDDETAVLGDMASFTISYSGEHALEFWAVDNVGNEENHHTVPIIKIDVDAPSVTITSPEPGFYLFGNKIFPMENIVLIGAFTLEASIIDDESGVYRAQFFLDDNLFGESTGSPFSVKCFEKHKGACVIKVTAEDSVHNTGEDTLEIVYYKFLQ